MSPVALECQLPWKRNVCPQDEKEPMSSLASHALPNDNKPALSQVPSWANNLDYNHISAVSPRSDMEDSRPTQNGHGRLNSSNNNSSAGLDEYGASHRRSDGARKLPQVPTISVHSPKASANDLLLMRANGNGAFNTDTDSSELTGHDEATPRSESDDDEVEIKPFGKIQMSSRDSSVKLKNRHNSPSPSEEETEDAAAPPRGKGVMFSLNHESSTGSSDDEDSSTTGISC